MTTTTIIRLVQATAVAAALAAPAAAAGAGGSGAPAPDWFERYALAHPYGQDAVADGRSPDTRDAALAASSGSFGQGFVERNDRAHFRGTGSVSSTPLVRDGRSPDTLDAAATAQPVELVRPTGFDWGDAGIGAALGAGALGLLGGGAALALTRRRQRVRAI